MEDKQVAYIFKIAVDPTGSILNVRIREIKSKYTKCMQNNKCRILI